MNDIPIPSERPTRLPVWGQWLIALMLLASFVSGVAIWCGKTVQAEELVAPGWLRGAIVLHGCLFPLQCILFGFLACHHIRVGWQMRSNLVAGFILEGVFAALIISGVGLYYAPEQWHDRIGWLHRLLGLALPVTLAAHWIVAHFWIRRVTTSAS